MEIEVTEDGRLIFIAEGGEDKEFLKNIATRRRDVHSIYLEIVDNEGTTLRSENNGRMEHVDGYTQEPSPRDEGGDAGE